MEIAVADSVAQPQPINRRSNPARDFGPNFARNPIDDKMESLVLRREASTGLGMEHPMETSELAGMMPEHPRLGRQHSKHRWTLDAIHHEPEAPVDLDQSIVGLRRMNRRAWNSRLPDSV